MAHLYTILKETESQGLQTLRQNIKKEEAMIYLSELTGYTVSLLKNSLKSLKGLEVVTKWNKREIIIKNFH